MTCEAVALNEMQRFMGILVQPEPGEMLKAAEHRVARMLGWNPFRVRDYRLGRARSVPHHEFVAAQRAALERDRIRLAALEQEIATLRARLLEDA